MRLSQTLKPRSEWSAIAFAVSVGGIMLAIGLCAVDIYQESRSAECRAKLCRSPFTDPTLMWRRCVCMEEVK